MPALEFSVSEFVSLTNQTLEYAYPYIVIVGEIANFRISKNRWVYFDLKDDQAIVRCFGAVHALPGPLEDGLLVRVSGTPRLHSLYGFSFNFQQISPKGEGAIKKSANLLEAKLQKEGLFNLERKRQLPFPPQRIGLITSSESAAYSDFVKIINARWGGLEISLIDVQVQGEAAIGQLTGAIEAFNQRAIPPEVIVIVRGGGSLEDLQAFSSEQVTRGVVTSRIPTLVAIGHERDISLSEKVADLRASTPSNAAELLVPDKRQVLANLKLTQKQLSGVLDRRVGEEWESLSRRRKAIISDLNLIVQQQFDYLSQQRKLIELLDPKSILMRGYSILYKGTKIVRGMADINKGDSGTIRLIDSNVQVTVDDIKSLNNKEN
jgi:exodeoxyribonuclease VII large subunit